MSRYKMSGLNKNSATALRNVLTHWEKRPSELAKILGVKDQQINNILTGKAKIPAKYLWKLATMAVFSYEALVEAVILDERARIDAAAKKYQESHESSYSENPSA